MIKHYYVSSRVFLLLIITLFILSRLNYLNLPYFWDEAWSYAPAVFDMHNHGLGLIPGSVDPELTRGHPLLFYFLAAGWTKLFGTSLLITHLFALLVSTLMLISFYFIALDLFDLPTARAATVLFMLQAFFLAQSTQLLPEIMLSLWTLLTVFAYFKKKWILFVLFSGFLVMTKETGMVLIGTLFIDKLILEAIFNKGQKKSGFILLKEIGFLLIPVLLFVSFLIIQKIQFGWFLFPEHTQLINFDAHRINKQFWIIFSKLLFQQGRGIFFFTSIFAVIYLLIKKSITRQSAHMLLFSFVFILCYTLFSSVNFFTPRYLISLLPFLIIPGTWLIIGLTQKNWIKLIIMGAFALLFSYYTFRNKQKETDNSLRFRNTVLLQKKAVNYAEDMNWQNQRIYSYFLMNYYMTNPDLGYLNIRSQPFHEVQNNPDVPSDIYIFCSNEIDPFYTIVNNSPGYILVKRFESRNAWVCFFKQTSR